MSSIATDLFQTVITDADELKERNTPKKAHENEVAVWLAAQTSARELLLFYRAQLRRGYVDQEQQHDIERHLARLQRTIGAQVDEVRGEK